LVAESASYNYNACRHSLFQPEKNSGRPVTFRPGRQDPLQEATTMTAPHDPDSDQLLQRVVAGDPAARELLLDQHRQRLRRMIALRLDRRLWARVDPSDVLQEALAEADQKLADYARRRPLPFYPWLRCLAWERLVQVHRRHIGTQSRSINREEFAGPPLPDASALELADRLAARGSSPSARLRRDEWRSRLRQALAQLADGDREVLVLRYLEDLSTKEVAAVLSVTEASVKMRQLRALRRLRDLLGDDLAEDLP
jgi:RNA polymerase sigma-70 factor (ECF subfamily)